MPSLESLLRVRSIYGGHFDADGQTLLFVADLASVPQVWASTPGERWPSLHLAPPDRAQTLHPGPRAGQLVVGADVGGRERRQLLLLQPGATDWRPLVDAPEVIHHFGGWSTDGGTVAYSDNSRTGRWFDVYLEDLAPDAEPRCVLRHDSSNYAGPIAPDGRTLVSQRMFSNMHQELWLVDLSGGEPARLSPAGEASFERPQWTPDGAAIVCLSDWQREYVGVARIEVATGKLSWIVEADGEVDDAALSPDGGWLAYALNHDGAAEVRLRELATGAERTVRGLPPGALYSYWQSGLGWSPDSGRVVVSWTGSAHPPNVWIVDRDDGQARQATFTPAAGVDLAELVEPEHVTYPTFDGRHIPALYFPARGASGAPPPCVVSVHGGPEGQFRPTFQPLVQSLVASGFAVLAPNVRGSTGYGKTYAHLDDVRLRMDSVADLAHAAYWLRDSGRADPARIAVYGGSYGGFMVLAALTSYPDLWAAGVDIVGIGNFVTFLENTGPWRRHLREAEYGSLDHDRDFLESVSPIHRVDQIRAPLYIIHGRNDPRVPISEAEAMARRLTELGRTVELLCLEDEGHQISKLHNKLNAYPRAARFLQQHLGVD